LPESNKLAQVGFTLAKFSTKLPARAVTDNFNLLAMDILDHATQIEIILPVQRYPRWARQVNSQSLSMPISTKNFANVKEPKSIGVFTLATFASTPMTLTGIVPTILPLTT
jgi:hypothetical protein